MTEPNHPQRTNVEKGFQPQPDKVEGGYQPRAEAPVDPASLKPPQGGTAIEPPKAAASKDSKQ